MSRASDYLEKKVLESLLIDGDIAGAVIWVALSTADPLDDCSGIAEPVGNSYTRVQKNAGTTHWNNTTGINPTKITNKTEIDFGSASGTGWGTITHVALFDRDIASLAIVQANSTGGPGAESFEVAGDQTAQLVVGAKLRVRGSTGNNGIYTIRAGSAFSGVTMRTTINVEENVASAVGDGTIDLLGNMLASVLLTSPQIIGAGAPFSVPVGKLGFTCD